MAGGESSTRFDSETYKKAQDSLINSEAPNLEEKIRLAKEQEAATKKVVDGVIRSQGFAMMGDKELYECRADAPGDLLKGFDDFTKTVIVTPEKTTKAAPQIPEIGASPIDFSKNPPSTPVEVSSSAPAQKIEAVATNPPEIKKEQNDSAGTVLTGSQEITKEAQATQDAIKAGNTSPENINNAMIKNIENGFAMLPKGLQDFFKGIFNFIKGISGNQDTKSAFEKFSVNPEGKAILEKFAKSETTIDGKPIITFNEGTNLTRSKKEKTPDGTKSDQTEPKTEKVDGNKIVLDKDTKITSVKEIAGVITLIAQNKDGSIDTYTVNAKEKSTPPVSPGATQTA